MTDAEKLREIATCLEMVAHKETCEEIADLLEVIPPETLAALKAGTWKAVPVEPTEKMLKQAWDECANGDEATYRIAYRAMLAAAPEKPE